MKTLFIVGKSRIAEHGGESYDDYIEVEDAPTQETIREWAFRIMGRIRRLWAEDEGSDQRCVVATYDAAAPYKVILMEVQLLLKEQEDITIELPFLTPQEKEEQDGEV